MAIATTAGKSLDFMASSIDAVILSCVGKERGDWPWTNGFTKKRQKIKRLNNLIGYENENEDNSDF